MRLYMFYPCKPMIRNWNAEEFLAGLICIMFCSHFFITTVIGIIIISKISSHKGDVIMGAIASQITSITIVYSAVYSDADERKHQRSASLAFVWGIHRGPVNSPHKWPVTRKIFPFDDVIMSVFIAIKVLPVIIVAFIPLQCFLLSLSLLSLFCI